MNSILITTLKKSNTNLVLKNLTNKYFLDKSWSFIKKSTTYSDNRVLILNSSKGNYFMFYWLILRGFSRQPHPTLSEYKSLHPKPLTTYSPHELLPFQILEFPFHKKTNDSFIFYIIFVLVFSYMGFKNDFSLKYSFVVKPDNFNFLIFLNKFYFPTTNY
jgi:hypothetical protein